MTSWSARTCHLSAAGVMQNALAWAGWDAEKIFWELAIEDIRAACDLFHPLYEETNGGDGYVSIEVSPMIAHDTDATAAQAHIADCEPCLAEFDVEDLLQTRDGRGLVSILEVADMLHYQGLSTRGPAGRQSRGPTARSGR